MITQFLDVVPSRTGFKISNTYASSSYLCRYNANL